MAGTNQEAVAQIWAGALVQMEMKSRELTYADLTKELNSLGIMDNERNVRNKVARGTFSAAFFLSCLQAMDCKQLDLDIELKGGPGRMALIEAVLRDR